MNSITFTAIVYIHYYITTAENVTNNVFIDNTGRFDIYISPVCRPNYCLSMVVLAALNAMKNCIKISLVL